MFKSALLASVFTLTTQAIMVKNSAELQLYAENGMKIENLLDTQSSSDNGRRKRRYRKGNQKGLGYGKRPLKNKRGYRRGSSSSSKDRRHKHLVAPKPVVVVKQPVPVLHDGHVNVQAPAPVSQPDILVAGSPEAECCEKTEAECCEETEPCEQCPEESKSEPVPEPESYKFPSF